MPIRQSWNKRNKAYVKYEMKGDKIKILDVKQREPSKPFKGVRITKKKPGRK